MYVCVCVRACVCVYMFIHLYSVILTIGVDVLDMHSTYACMMMSIHAHSRQTVLTISVAPDALLPADCEAVQTETSCSAAA